MISLLLPTRNRPESVARFVDYAVGKATCPDQVQVLFYVDDDDETVMPELPEQAEVIRGPRVVMSDYWNKLAMLARGEIMGLMGDDIIIRTKGWDEIVCSAFDEIPDKIAYVHGKDGLQDGRLGTHGFLHRRWIQAVGKMTGPHFSCDYADAWINDIANMLGRRVYLPYLMTEHWHPAAGKGEFDDSHRERMARGARDNVAQIFEDTYAERVADAEILRGLMHVT